MHPLEDISRELADIEARQLKRGLNPLASLGGKWVDGDRTVLNFSSNDYLDLAGDTRLKSAAKQAVEEYGCGATASRLMAGHLDLHAELEAELASLTGCEASLVFASGFQANLGAVTALAGREGAVFSDALNHASIVDGCRLAHASVNVYRHQDTRHLAELLAACTASGRKIVVTDSVFSMDGHMAPLEEIRELSDAHEALLVVDEAHALGIYGKGRGLCPELGVRADVITGALAKSFGGGGGFAASSQLVVDYLINTARPFIFSSGLSPANAAAALEATRIMRREPELGDELLSRADAFRHLLRAQGLDVAGDRSQIVPVLIGDNAAALDAANALRERGFLITAIRPPSVPKGTARLRLSVTLAHSDDDLARAAAAIGEVAQPTSQKVRT